MKRLECNQQFVEWLIKESGMNILEFCKHYGLNRRTVYGWMRYGQKMDLNTAIRLANDAGYELVIEKTDERG